MEKYRNKVVESEIWRKRGYDGGKEINVTVQKCFSFLRMGLHQLPHFF